MGNALGNAVNSFGTGIGNTLVAPIKSVFTKSCENICTGAWDLFCFIEHFCIADLVKLLLIFCISYIGLLFLYMLFKLGIGKCVVKSMFKMCWDACETCCFVLECVCCFCWRRISNTKRVYRGHRGGLKDVELGYTSAEESLYLASGKSSRHLQIRSLNKHRTKKSTSKRRRLR